EAEAIPDVDQELAAATLVELGGDGRDAREQLHLECRGTAGWLEVPRITERDHLGVVVDLDHEAAQEVVTDQPSHLAPQDFLVPLADVDDPDLEVAQLDALAALARQADAADAGEGGLVQSAHALDREAALANQPDLLGVGAVDRRPACP